MRVLGIDPGTIRMGYALLHEDGPVLEASGCLYASASIPLAQRLHQLHKELVSLVNELKPDEAAIEEPFISRDKGPRSGIAVGQAQAVALVAITSYGTPISTYPPAKIKQVVTGYGAGSKDQVAEMVRLQLGLREILAPQDTADAAAVALTHLRLRHTTTWLRFIEGAQ